MKKILLSLGIILATAGFFAAGATGAFFSDTETSSGNTFTAGALDLTVASTAHYDGLVCTGGVWVLEDVQAGTQRPDLVGQPCGGTWSLKDLNPLLDRFFDFTDVKPGDSGENTITTTAQNDRYACLDFTNIHNDDNTQTEPEVPVDLNGLVAGELAQHMNILFWSDNGALGHAGNNIWDADETGSIQVTMPTVNRTFRLADSTTGPTLGGAVRSLGFAWCAGVFTSFGPGITPVCDGSTMGDESQTDSYRTDLTLRSVQARNNPNFICTTPTL